MEIIYAIWNGVLNTYHACLFYFVPCYRCALLNLVVFGRECWHYTCISTKCQEYTWVWSYFSSLIQLPEDDTPKGVKVILFQCLSFLPLPVYSLNSVYWLLKPTSAAAVWVQNIMLMCISFRDHIHIDWRQGYLLPTLAWKITCRCFDWTLQSSSLSPWRRLEHSVETSAFSRNVGKLFLS